MTWPNEIPLLLALGILSEAVFGVAVPNTLTGEQAHRAQLKMTLEVIFMMRLEMNAFI